MDWTQLISLAGYTTAVCYFFYRLNEKSIDRQNDLIKEWRDEHKSQIQENEKHWREMFTHFNNRLDTFTKVK